VGFERLKVTVLLKTNVTSVLTEQQVTTGEENYNKKSVCWVFLILILVIVLDINPMIVLEHLLLIAYNFMNHPITFTFFSKLQAC